MIYVVVEEIWSLPVGQKEAELQQVVGQVAAEDGREAASMRARELASRFAHRSFENDAKYPYHWGRNDSTAQVHRFVIKPSG
jgi:hypothetical protein